MSKVPVKELKYRLKRFKEQMDIKNPDWMIAVIFSKINLYYFTGTMQDGMLIIPRDDEATFWIRRSYERALYESSFEKIESMNSFRDAVENKSKLPHTIYIETETVPLAFYQRFNKHFAFKDFKPLDIVVAATRSVKSEYELRLMRKSGEIHQHVLEYIAPDLLIEGMSEADLGAKMYKVMVDEGYHGITRFGMFDTEMLLGHIGFGDSSIYPTYFDGASGTRGLCHAVPLLGSRERKLMNGDLVYIDIGCGVEGYNTDKTVTYMFGRSIPQYAVNYHNKCVEIQNQIASMLKPGILPSEIYRSIMDGLDDDFKKNFMGFGNHKVKFLGHGIGLLIDELPVIADGFDTPLQEGMVFAIEPKRGIKDVGMVGIENTFIVTSKGGECITGNSPGLIPVF